MSRSPDPAAVKLKRRTSRAEVEVPHFSRVTDDGEGRDIFEVVPAALLADLLDTQQASGGGCRTAVDLDPGPAQGCQIFGLRDLLAEGQPERFQTLVKRSDRVVAHRRDPAVAQIDGGQRLEHVVELSSREVDAEV